MYLKCSFATYPNKEEEQRDEKQKAEFSDDVSEKAESWIAVL